MRKRNVTYFSGGRVRVYSVIYTLVLTNLNLDCYAPLALYSQRNHLDESEVTWRKTDLLIYCDKQENFLWFYFHPVLLFRFWSFECLSFSSQPCRKMNVHRTSVFQSRSNSEGGLRHCHCNKKAIKLSPICVHDGYFLVHNLDTSSRDYDWNNIFEKLQQTNKSKQLNVYRLQLGETPGMRRVITWKSDSFVPILTVKIRIRIPIM